MQGKIGDTRACHICGQQRSPKHLSIERHKTVMPGTNEKVEEQVLYCNDKAECRSAAPAFSFIRPPRSASAGRRATKPGAAPVGMNKH